MSRIAGIINSNNFNDRLSLNSGLLVGRDQSRFEIAEYYEDSVYLIYQRPASFYKTLDDLVVIIDGYLFNKNEYGLFENDAELIAKLYKKFGFEGLLKKIDGDFAIALFDNSNRTLYLARDRIGIRPLYYSISGEKFYFSSRPAALIEVESIGKVVDEEFIIRYAGSHYRYFDNYPHRSPYKKVDQLPAASWLAWKNNEVNISEYWCLTDQEEWSGNENILAEEYRETLLSAINKRLKIAKKPAFLLSGGMDSSSVLSGACYLSKLKYPAYTSVYDDKKYDESDDVVPMLTHSVSQWYPINIKIPDLKNILPEIISIHDEPIATATWLSHYLVCKEAAQDGFLSLFGGLGGDELNAGEYEYFFFHFADLYYEKKMAILEEEIKQWAFYHDHPIWKKNYDVAINGILKFTDQSMKGRCLPALERLLRYNKALNPDYGNLNNYTPVMETKFSSYLKSRTWQDISRETTPCCLRSQNRNSVSFGLNTMDPFLDYRLIEFMFRVPGSYKICNGVTKTLLRKSMRGILPEETRTRIKKTGWNAPAHLWFSGRGYSDLMDIIHSRSFIDRGIYNCEEVYKLAKEHKEIVDSSMQQEDHMMFFWQLMNLYFWLEGLSK